MKNYPVIRFRASTVLPGIHPETGFVALTWFLPVEGAIDLFKRVRFHLGRN